MRHFLKRREHSSRHFQRLVSRFLPTTNKQTDTLCEMALLTERFISMMQNIGCDKTNETKREESKTNQTLIFDRPLHLDLQQNVHHVWIYKQNKKKYEGGEKERTHSSIKYIPLFSITISSRRDPTIDPLRSKQDLLTDPTRQRQSIARHRNVALLHRRIRLRRNTRNRWLQHLRLCGLQVRLNTKSSHKVWHSRLASWEVRDFQLPLLYMIHITMTAC